MMHVTISHYEIDAILGKLDDSHIDRKFEKYMKRIQRAIDH